MHHHAAVEGNTRRIGAETTSQNSTYLILAANRTHRKDPTDSFNYYTGGWNITNPHYIFSVAYSATGPFVFAVVWFIFFAVFLLCFCCRCCFCSRNSYGYSRTAYAVSVTCLAIFTIAAIAGIAFVFAGQDKFQDSIVNTTSFVLHEADDVIVKLGDVLHDLLAAKNSSVGRAVLPDDLKADIDSTGKTINAVTAQFRNITTKNSQDIRSLLSPLRLMLIYVASALLILAVLGFLLSILGLGCLVYSLAVVGWILVAATFMMSGVFLLVHNAVADTCVALDEWLQNPTAHSALEAIIPQVDNQTAQEISSVTKGVTFGVVEMLNGIITNVSNADVPPDVGPPLYFHQNGPLVPVACNPYDSNLTDRKCADGEVSLKDAPQVWKKYVCQVSGGICRSPGRITPDNYDQLASTANISYALYEDTPFVVGLIDSTYLKELFGDISRDYCPGLSKFTSWMYLGFISSSVAVMLSLLIWIFYARERRHRAYTKKVDSRSSAENPFAS
nr:uncharacterized protein LOC113692456 [Coffea arabica]XP_027070509.1 uncharacterized protein LOC113695575 [Coffea arabica]